MVAGLEPTCGYLHFRSDRVVNSLVHDLQEPFRALVDVKLLAFFLTTTFHRGDFYQILSGECRLNEQLRRYILASCRLPQPEIDSLITWLVQTVTGASIP